MAKVYIVIYNIYRMRAIFKNTICIFIFCIIIYLICVMNKPKKQKPLYMKKFNANANPNANANANTNASLNADLYTNANAFRSQESELGVDRMPLVEENTVIIAANEIVPMNYKDCQCKDQGYTGQEYKDQVEKELYATDKPLFTEMGPINLVPLDVNDSSHKRVNFY